MNYLTKKMQAKAFKYKGHRNSYTELNEVYFWTITVNQWQHLLKAEENKMIIIDSLQWMVQKELVKIYGYVIMPKSYSSDVGTIGDEWKRVSEKQF